MFGPFKPLGSAAQHGEGQTLAKTLSWPHLIALGVGAIVGTGIYTLTGVGAERAGPAVIPPLPSPARSAPVPRSLMRNSPR